MKWIKYSEQLPEDDQNVFGWKIDQTSSFPVVCYYDKEMKSFLAIFSFQELYADIDYWMEMPNPPED